MGRGWPVALSCALACASSPRPAPKVRRPPCNQPAIGEAYGVGGLGGLKMLGGSASGERPSVFGPDRTVERRPPHLDEPLPEVELEDVEVEHTALGRGARSDVVAHYRAP